MLYRRVFGELIAVMRHSARFLMRLQAVYDELPFSRCGEAIYNYVRNEGRDQQPEHPYEK